jgi:glucose/arabinose dehydrogenase
MRSLLRLAGCVAALVLAGPAAAQFAIGGDPRVNPSDFRITTFATGLNFPNGMARLSDGSILVATSNPSGSFFNSSGALLRFTDTNDDGIADGSGQVMYTDPVGVWAALKVAGNLVFVTSAQSGAERIIILRMNSGPASRYTFVGTLNFGFPAGWEHKSYALAVRPVPGGPANTYELYFNIGSSANSDESTDPVLLSGLLTGSMEGASIYRVTVIDTGTGATVSNLTHIAKGLRNAAGMDFHPATGDLYFEDNGIDGVPDRNEPLSADELNRIAAADLGVILPDFGFPNDYIDYHTGQRVGSGGVQPLASFRPLPCVSCPDPGDAHPDGAESEGPSGVAFAPPSFPPYLNNGIFIGFHGKFADPPTTNEENPLVFWDLGTGQYFHFIESFQLGHGDQLLATDDSLFIADMSSDGQINVGRTGKIYQIKRRAEAALSLAYNGELRDSVGQGNIALAADGEPDGTLTATLSAGGGRTITRLSLQSSGPGLWDTDGTTPYWALGVATTVDGPLVNDLRTAAVNLAVPDGGTFVVFAADYAGSEFVSGATLTLTATFSDGMTATATTTVMTPPAALSVTYNGKLVDRVGQGNLALVPDGAADGTLTATLSAPGGRTVIRLSLQSNGPGLWDTDGASPYWALGVATTVDGPLTNDPRTAAVNFPVPDGGTFVVFASDYAGIEFVPGGTLTLTATFSDGTTATATIVTPAAAVGVRYNGKVSDRVGQGNLALVADGAADGTLTATLSARGGRTVTRLSLQSSGPGLWDTDGTSPYWALGVATTLNDVLLNDLGTAAVNFPVADGGTFVVFASDYAGIEFVSGATLTLVATFSDGTMTSAATRVP